MEPQNIFFNFEQIDFLFYGLLFILFYGVLVFIIKKKASKTLKNRSRGWGEFFESKNWNKFYGRFHTTKMMVIVFLFGVALASPYSGWNEVDVQFKVQQRWLMMLDVSQSMAVRDHFGGERLQAAKQQMLDVLRRSSAVSVGVVIFSNVAVMYCPFTSDIEAVANYIQDISTDFLTASGSELKPALELAKAKMIDIDALNSNQKFLEASVDQKLFVFSDGEFVQQSLPEAMSLVGSFVNQKIKIFSFAFGSEEGAPVPDRDGRGFKKNSQSNVVISRREDSTLKDIASQSGGGFYNRWPSNLELQSMLSSSISGGSLDQGSQKMRNPKLLHRWLLVLVFILILHEIFFNHASYEKIKRIEMKKKLASFFKKLVFYKKSYFIYFCLLGFSSIEVLADASFEKAKAHAEGGDWDSSVKELDELVAQHQNEPYLHYNAGVAKFRTGNFQDAKKHFEISSMAEETFKDLRYQSFYNLGNTEVALNQLDLAAAAYQKALELKPDSLKAKENLKWVQDQLKNKQEGESNDAKESSTKENQESNSDTSKTPNDSSNQKENDSSKTPSISDPNSTKSNPSSSKDESKATKDESSANGDSKLESTEKKASDSRSDAASGETKKDSKENLGSKQEPGSKSDSSQIYQAPSLLDKAKENKQLRQDFRKKQMENQVESQQKSKDAESSQDW